ncbi:kynurenine formamidase [Anopheles darlingi]|uniref:kynurenine formamidase n=1 Tax=Anopheles darlingi TaxID=43151 RepID=UPI0021004DC0|nr:kynurenine formamidase [Anopheles darlingi]XP_049536544.1 kynurenine formamidase [Anopheles darlingi]
MAKHSTITFHRRGPLLIRYRSFVVCTLFVSGLALVADRLPVGEAEPLDLSFVKQFLRNRVASSKSKAACVADMKSDAEIVGPPTAETLAIWEKEYSPSAWSVRFPTPAEVINYHVQFVKQVSDANRAAMTTRLDIDYGSGEREKVDIYGEDLPEDAPLFVYIHGGYWQMLEKETSGYPAKPLVDRGIRVMIIGYELCPSVTLDELVNQIRVAGEFVLNYATEHGVRQVAMAGHSAGAHLIASMLDQQFKSAVGGEEFALLKDVYLISGVYDVQELRYTTSVNRDNLLGLNDNNVLRLSPLSMGFSHLTGDAAGPRFHVYVAEHDSEVFRDMASRMNSHLESFTLPCDLNVLPGLDHFDIVENLSKTDHPLTIAILKGFDKTID